MRVLQYNIYKHGHMNATYDADYIIVLGSKVNGTKPSYSLQYRIDKAAEYLKSHEKTIAIVSGGQGKGEDISEALAMKQGLMKQNIAEDRIIMEDKSTSTDENITFSKTLIPANMKKGMIVTNDFHMFRAKRLQKTRIDIRRSSSENTKANYYPIERSRVFSNYSILVYESNIVKKESRLTFQAGFLMRKILQNCHLNER